MDILIKGMEMPKNCGERRFAGACGVHNSEEWPDIESIILNDVIGVGGTRDEDCPIVEVAPHGRLIDADSLEGVLIFTLESLKENPKMDKEEMHLIAAFHTLGVMVDDAPTIIEAEGD